MGQLSANYALTTESNSRSYTGQNATFSTFKPESDDEEDETEKGVEPVKNTLLPSSKYPNSSGSRPNTSGGRPNSARENPVKDGAPPANRPYLADTDNFHLQGFPSGKSNDYHDSHNPNRTRLNLANHFPSSHVSYPRESESKPPTCTVATMLNSTHINAAYVEDSDDESDEFRGTVHRNKLDYAVESSGSITPPLPPLSPDSSRPATPPFNPKFGRSYSASNVSPPKTPDLLSSTSKLRNPPTTREHLRASNLYMDIAGKERDRPKRSPRQKAADKDNEGTYSIIEKVPKGNG